MPTGSFQDVLNLLFDAGVASSTPEAEDLPLLSMEPDKECSYRSLGLQLDICVKIFKLFFVSVVTQYIGITRTIPDFGS